MKKNYDVYVRNFNKDEFEQFINSTEVRTGANCKTCFNLMRVEENDGEFKVLVGLSRSHAHFSKSQAIENFGGFEHLGWQKLDPATWRS